MEANTEKILEIIRNEVESNIDFDNLKTDIPLDDQGMDSLDHSSMFLGIEEEYDITISDDDIESLSTIDDIVSFVNAKVNES